MGTIKFTLDGKEITGQPGQTILKAAETAGVYIPRLCAYKDLIPRGSCRVCSVRVNGRIQAACVQTISDGMVVENDTAELREFRRAIVDMLFVEGNHYCMFCEKSGLCELQALAYRFGITAPQFPLLNPDRAIEGVRVASRIGLGVAAVVGAMFVLVPRYLLAVFGMTDPMVLSIAQNLLLFLSVSGLFITVALSYTGGLQGTGDTRSPLYISIISQVAVPLGLCTVFEMTGMLDPSEIWLAIVAGHFTRMSLSVTRFRQQKWKNIAVDIEPARP